jgi:hypothetical protein
MELSAAPKGEKKKVLERYSTALGISTDTIYRELRKRFGKKKTIIREPKYPQWLIDEFGKTKLYGMQGIGEREVSTELTKEILLSKGIIDAEKISISTANRRMAESGFRQREPIKRIESEYANQTHQMDFSRSKCLQLKGFDKTKNDYILITTTKYSAYKENESSYRTWYVGIIDTYSRLPLAQCYAATGESSLIGIEFCNFAYNRPADAHPMLYLPEKMKTDNGAFIKDKSVKAMFESLEIPTEKVIPYKKRGIQKRESAWKFLWQRVELPLYIKMGEGATIYLSEFNELIHEEMIKVCDYKHPIKNETRGHIYKASLTAHPPRVIDFDLRETSFRVIERTVNQALMVSIDNQKYEAPQYALDKRIRIYKNRIGEVVGELVDEIKKPFILKPTEGYVFEGDYHREFEQTYRQKLESEMKEESREQRAEGKEQSKINYIPPRTKKVVPKTKFTEALPDANYSFPDAYSARVYIGKQLGRERDYLEYADVFEPLLQKDLSKKSIDEVLSYINNQAAII